MSSLRKIVCLANSRKNGERCIAGIDLDSGKWVRPVYEMGRYANDGRIPIGVRLIKGREPELLDIIEIPLSHTGNNFGFECENQSILPGEWRYLGKAQAADLLEHCSQSQHILHSSGRSVSPDYLKAQPFGQRRTLELVHAHNFSAYKSRWSGWQGTFSSDDISQFDAKITDPDLTRKLEGGCSPGNECLLTISLSMPFSPGGSSEPLCWKLIAGVIEMVSKPQPLPKRSLLLQP